MTKPTDAQLVEENIDDKIRRIIREEMAGYRAKKDAEEAPQAPPANDPYALDGSVSPAEREAYAPVLQGYGLRKQAGMSDDLAEVMAKIDRGMDLTPLDYNFPTGEGAESYFKKPGFQEAFVERVKTGEKVNAAYEATCEQFGVPTLAKSDVRDRILKELPERPYGAFSLGAGEVRERFGGPALLGRPDEAPAPGRDVHGSLGGVKLPDE